jgi:Cu+-exporting ATPase
MISCSHCNDECSSNSICIDDKVFCCEGCKTVYQILSENQLNDYYAIDKTPGVTPKPHFIGKFSYLDDDDVLNKLLIFNDDDIAVIQFEIPAIHCSSCVWLLERLNYLQKGVISSQVNFIKKTLRVTYNSCQVKLSEIVEKIAVIGYEPIISLEMLSEEKEAKNKEVTYRLGVAGFCFGNIMLLSLADYLGMDKNNFTSFYTVFNYLNFVLSLPVLFYSAWPYFNSAFRGLKQKWLNIDVPISLGILVLFLRSSYEVFSKVGTGYFDSLSGLVFFLLIGKFFQNKTYKHLSFERDYKSYFPMAVTLINKGNEIQISVKKLKKGDKILVRNEELIPADCILISGDAKIDNSFVTGENRNILKSKGEIIYAGGKQIGSSIELEVLKEVSHSYLTGLWNSTAFDKNGNKSIRGITDKISKYFTLVILIIASVSGVIWMQTDVGKAIQVVSAILIVACPCALALSAPFALGNTLRIFGNNKLYLKNTAVIEQMSKISDIVFDKTGTITISGKSTVNFVGNVLDDNKLKVIKSICRNSSHPLSRIIYNSIESEVLVLYDYKEIIGKGMQAIGIRIGSAEFLKVDKVKGISQVHLEIEGVYLGYFKIESTKRGALKTTIDKLNKKVLHLISGDNDAEILDMQTYFPEGNICFDMLPPEKLNYIAKLQKSHKKVMMIGDGLNDAGALQQSNVGISISEDINSFSPACDAILDASNFNKLPLFIKFSKMAMKVVYISFFISFMYNIVGMYFAIKGDMTPIFAAILMPVSSITIVVFTTVSTNSLFKKINR